jgi:hypothetical protein
MARRLQVFDDRPLGTFTEEDGAMCRRALAAILLLAVALMGCSPAARPTVNYEVRGEDGGGTITGRSDEGVHTAGKNRLQIKDGRILANEKDFGAVKEGDKVVLDKDGRVFVNGEERK